MKTETSMIPAGKRVKVCCYKHRESSGEAGIFDLVEDGFAVFHQFGHCYFSGISISSAIIERENGKVENVPVHLIQFDYEESK